VPKNTYILIFLLSSLFAKPQKHEFNITYGYGPSYFFIDNVSHQRMNTSSAIGLNYMYNMKGGIMSFGSGITYCRNDYHRKIDYNGLVHVTQKLWGLNLEALMRLSKKAYLRVGILLNKISHTNINVSYKTQGAGYYGYGYGEMYEGYSSTQFQASACAGMVFPVKVKRRKLKFGFTLQQQATSIVDSDYYIKHTLNAESYNVLSANARPTRLLFCLEIGLKRDKKKEEE
jgi:hypothetical protein